MKYLIYCLPRTRSTFLQDVIAQTYNLKNLEEPYHRVDMEAKKGLIRLDDEIVWSKYQNRIIEITKNLAIQDNIVVKIFSDTTFNHVKNIKIASAPNFELEYNDLLDIEKFCAISMYNKIYILYRKNITNFICSYRYGHNFGKLQYKNNIDDKNISEFRKKQKVNLVLKENLLAMDVLEYVLFQLQAKHLNKTYQNIVNLEYDEIPLYINKNFPHTTSNFIGTNFDYKILVKNYNEIDYKVNYYFDKFSKLLSE